jgi:hypothetical protein
MVRWRQSAQRLRSRRKNNFSLGQHQKNPAPARSLTRFPCQSSACQKAQADPSLSLASCSLGPHRRQQMRAQLREGSNPTSCTRLNCVAGAGAAR